MGGFGLVSTNTTFAGVIQDGATNKTGLTIDSAGGGPFILTGTNLYTGLTLICDCGSLQIGNGGTTGSIVSDVVDNNLLIFDRSNTYNFSNLIVDGFASGRVEQLGTGTLILSGNNFYSGGTRITAGTLQVNNNNAVGTGAIILNGGILQPGANNLELSNNVRINATEVGGSNPGANVIGTVNVTGARTFILDGVISDGNGAGTLGKTGTGRLILNGANTYSGGTSLSGGTLGIGTSTALGTGAVNTSGTVTLLYNDGVSVANTVTTTGGGTAFSVDFGFTATQLGLVTATGQSIGKTGNGTLIVGDLSGVGSTFVTGGTLQGHNANAFGSGNAMFVNAGTLDLGGFNQSIGSLNGTNSGTVTNNGASDATLTTGTPAGSTTFEGLLADGTKTLALTFDGSATNGTLILDNNNTYTGATSVLGGTLQIDGSIVSATTVGNSGALAGNGSVGAVTVNSGGTLLPGAVGAPGTLTVNGNLNFNAGANYVVYMTPTTVAKTTVNGTASLAGTLYINAASVAGYKAGTYVILSATGGLGGTSFGTVNVLGALQGARNPRVTYDYINGFVDLLLDPGTITVNPGFTGNQGNVAGGINNAIIGGANVPAGFNTLLNLTGSALTGALDQISGQSSGGIAQAGTQMMTSFLTLLLNPFGGTAANNAGGGSGAIGFAREFGAGERLSPEAAAAYAAIMPRDQQVAANFSQRWSFWGGGFGGSSKFGGNSTTGTNDTTAQTYGFAAGADYRVAADLVVGFALAGGGTSWGVAQGLGGGRSDVFQIGGYASKTFGAAYVSAAVAYAWHNVTTDRTITVAGTDKLEATFDAQSVGARLEGGYRFVTAFMGITPYAAVQVQNFHTPGYSESAVTGSSTFALSYDSRSVTSTRFELGSWFDKVVMLKGGNAVALRTRLAWANDHSSGGGIAAAFQTLPGSAFTVNGAAAPNNSALLSQAAELRLTNRVSLGAKFDGEFASRAQTYAGTGTVRYTW